MPTLTVKSLCSEAKDFSILETRHSEPTLFGKDNGKQIGTYLDLKFQNFLMDKGYSFERGNAANGLDFPGLNIDLKTTSINQPQSSCPFRSIRQKIYGLGYGLLVFIYDKKDDDKKRTATLSITDTVYVEAKRTADFQMTKGLIEILNSDGNVDDLMSFMISRYLTTDEIELIALAEHVLQNRPEQGYLTISPALQWRLQYTRIKNEAGLVDGVHSLYKGKKL